MRWVALGCLLVACKNGDGVDTDTDTDTPVETTCAGVPESACPELEGCMVVQGTPVNGSLQFAGCATDQNGCGDALTAAEDPDTGTCWQFADTCVPDGWTVTGTDCQ
ncbi:MAG: hypothetical protein R3F61_26095 [Myxococcota bacterium]